MKMGAICGICGCAEGHEVRIPIGGGEDTPVETADYLDEKCESCGHLMVEHFLESKRSAGSSTLE